MYIVYVHINKKTLRVTERANFNVNLTFSMELYYVKIPLHIIKTSNLSEICSTNIEVNITITNARLIRHGRSLCDPFVKVNEANLVVSRFDIIRQKQI